MATNHTEHYQLNLWEPSDKFLREEINENTQKLDAALSQKADASAVTAALAKKADAATVSAALAKKADAASQLRLVTGSYIGTGEYGPEHPNVLEVPDAERPPRFVMVLEEGAARRAFLMRGMTKTDVFSVNSTYSLNVEWTNKGVKWYGSDSLYQLNYIRSDQTFKYFYVILI